MIEPPNLPVEYLICQKTETTGRQIPNILLPKFVHPFNHCEQKEIMIVRIVKMTFQNQNTAHFIAIFERSKTQIRNFPGCMHLELLQDIKLPNIYYTYSYWTGEEALESYRQSDLFKTTWAQTKVLFAAKAEAVSLVKLVEVT